MKLYVGADHRGYALKESLKPWLESLGHEVVDCGATELVPDDDWVDFGEKVGKAVVKEEGARGVLMCGTGVGVSVAANKVRGVRCAVGLHEDQVKDARLHDDVNVLAVAADFTDEEAVKGLVKRFLETSFEGGERYMRRLEKLQKLEQDI